MSPADDLTPVRDPAEPEPFDGIVVSPATGEAAAVASCTDAVFAQEMMGTGFVVRPTDGRVISPVPGTVELVHATGHAYGIRTSDGREVIVHVGIDTVELGGAPFAPLAEQGDVVAAGDPLVLADLAAIEATGRSTEVVVVLSGTPADRFALMRTGLVIAGEAMGRYR